MAVAVVVVLVVRPLTAGLSLVPWLPAGDVRLDRSERRVVAFFGVRGVGTFYYLAYVTGEAAGLEDLRPLWSTVAFAVLLSVVVHGVLATPVMARLDRARSAA